ncbi:MAG: ribonuclease HI [Planctomycetes bacterium]|nr:ribonuclease HI [Planctomycetota bacterium]
MPSFECQVCRAAFDVPQKALDKYPGWTPKFCREHSPKKGGAAKASGGGARARTRTTKRDAGPREEHLTRAQVLERYADGPADGVFTDGSSVPNPGPGGWGVVWVRGGEVRAERHGHEARTTNNRMELRALIAAFELLPEDAEEVVWTDSRLCVDTITKWAPGWEKRGWKRKGGEIANLELVQELYALARAHPRCALRWIEAHAGNRWNEYADSLATAWLRDEL